MDMEPAGLRFRAAEPEDAAAVAHLWACTFDDKMGHIFGQGVEPLLVRWLSRQPEAYAGTFIADAEGHGAGYIQFGGVVPPPGRMLRTLWRMLRSEYGCAGALKRLIQLWISESSHHFAAQECYIQMLGVDPAFRGRGIGRALLDFAETRARDKGKTRLTLAVVETNDKAIGLYERFGFTRGRRRRSAIVRWAIGHRGYYEMDKTLED